MRMANIFKRKKEENVEIYNAWAEMEEDMDENTEEAADAEEYEEQEYEEAFSEDIVYEAKEPALTAFSEDGEPETGLYEEEEYAAEENAVYDFSEEAEYTPDAEEDEGDIYASDEEEDDVYASEEEEEEDDVYASDAEEYDAEEYDVEEYDDEEYDDEEYDEEEKEGFFSGMTTLDKLLTFGGAAFVMLAILVGGFLLLNPVEKEASVSNLVVGEQLSNIDIIGQSGLLAVAEQEQNRLQALEDILREEDTPEYEESEYNDNVTVSMTLTSIEKDLKIKFTNKKSGKLVGNVPFSVEVTDADGNTGMWSDDDMDGIIYKKKLTPGEYKVTAIALDGEKYAKYDLPQATHKIEVKSAIVIQKVDVSNEIKTEAQVDVSKEDTAKKDTQVEEYLQDTVTWIESSMTEAGYTEVDKELLKAPVLPSVTTGVFGLRRFFTISGGDNTVTPLPTQTPSATQTPVPTAEPTAEPTTEPTMAPTQAPLLTQGTLRLDQTALVMSKQRTATVKVTETAGFVAEKELVYTASTSSDAVATAEVDNTGIVTITSKEEGEAVITVTANYKEGGSEKTAATAEIAVKVAQKELQLHTLELTVYTTMKDTITAFVKNAGVEEAAYKIEAISSDTEVATVTVDKREITVSGIKAGTADITVTYTEGDEVLAKVCKVTVLDHPMTDKKTKLLTEEGEQVYVYEDSKYREAVSADYYTETKFYVLGEAKYTGWQTLNGKVYYFDATGQAIKGEQVIQGVKYNFASDGTLVTGNGVMGIDVSKWNGSIDWKAVKNSGVSYVIIRCGYRGSSQGALIEDSKFKENIEGAINAGLKVGVYFFTQAVDNAEALEEASMVLDLIKKYKISYPVFLDVEASGGRADALSKEERTAICKTFCETIQKYGYTAGIYANKTWLNEKLDASALSGYKIWLAQYASVPTYTGRYDMWQYKDSGKVSGISGNVDLNMSYLGY